MPRSMLVMLCLASFCLCMPVLAQENDEAPPPEGMAPISIAAPSVEEQPATPPASLETPSAPSTSQQTPTVSGATTEQLQRQIDGLRRQIEGLKSTQKDNQPSEAPLPEAASEVAATAPSPASAGGATLLPDISVIGNLVGRVSNKPEPDRDRMLLDELEVGFQSSPYPNVRADAYLSAAREEDFRVSLEEGYLTLLQIGNTPFGAKLGKMRTPFGKLNPRHPHQWPFVDQPPVLSEFLGEDGLNSNGAFVQFLMPTNGKYFANLEVGSSDVDSESPFSGKLTTGRLWASKAMGDAAEAELGTSYAVGNEAPYEYGRRNPLHLLGVDFTYRSWPDTYKRWLLMAEWLQQTRSLEDGSGKHGGYYALGEYQFNRYWKFGIRYDWTQLPYPETDRISGISGILTNQLNEATFLRLQFTHGNDPEFGNINRAFLQIVFGIGPHSHPLQ